MNDVSPFSSNWQDWLVVSGYVGFTLFIMWRVLISKR